MRVRMVAVVLGVLLLVGLVQPASADARRILGGILLGYLVKESHSLSDSQVAQLGEKAVQEIEGKQEATVDPRVSRIGRELVSQAKLRSIRFRVLKDPEHPEGKNAFAVPTQPGTIYVTSGLLAELSDDQLAFVLGHEIGHLDKGHARQNLKRSGERRGAIVGLLVATGANETWQEVAKWGDFFATNQYSQTQELEADEYGYQLVASAGRDPEAAIEAFAKLQDGGEPPRWLNSLFNTHPLISDRQKRLAVKAAVQSQPTSQTTPTSNPAPQGPTVVVVIDPEAGYSYGYGFGRGYYYTEDLSRVARQEAEATLEERGYQVLVSTQDVGPLQEELSLENSEWGQYGEHRQPIGYFSGAQTVFYVSAYVQGEQGYEVGNWRNQVRFEGLKVGVLLRQIDLKTRRQLVTFQGTDSAAALSQVRASIGREWYPIEIQLEQIENLARRAVNSAVRKALSSLQPPLQTQPGVTVVIRLWEADGRTPATDTVLLITSQGEQEIEVKGQRTLRVEPGTIAIKARVRPGFTKDNTGWEMPENQSPKVMAQPGQAIIWDLCKIP